MRNFGYKFVNFGTEKNPVAPKWRDRIDWDRGRLTMGGGGQVMHAILQGVTFILCPSAVALAYRRSSKERVLY